MSQPADEQIALETAHILYLDIVGYSKLPSKEQRAAVDELNSIVRNSEQVQKAETADRLIKIPTGDGMALVFYSSQEAPAKCALEIYAALTANSRLPVRMGLHSGSVTGVIDVNGRANLAGAGLNIAQRVMDCGDAGHILISKNVADDLHEYEHWRPLIHSLGSCEVKHGVKLHIANLYGPAIGNGRLPNRIRAYRRRVARKWFALAAAVVILAMLALTYKFYFQSGSAASGSAPNKSIAVLPFKPLLAENSDPVIEFGMADTLIAKLGSMHEIVVPSLTSVRRFAGADQDPVAAGRKLGVESVLEGTISKARDILHVTVRLIRVADGSSLWAQSFDENMTDVFTVQDTISQKVVEALALRLNPEDQKRLTKRYTENVEAYQLYLTGRYHWNKLTPPDIRKSIGFFEQAADIDPRYALAYFGLAEAYRTLGITSEIPAKEIFPQSKTAAMKALQLDSSLGEPHATLAMIHLWFDWDWAAAEQEAKTAIRLNPNSAVSHLAYAQLLSTLGRHSEATAEAARAGELDPVSLIGRTREAAFLYLARRYDDAEKRLLQALELDPNFWIAQMYLGKTYLAQGKQAEASAAFTKALANSHGNSEAISMMGYFYGKTGDQVKARETLDQLLALSNQRFVPPYSVALVYAGLDQQPEALTWLEKAFEQRDPRVTWLKVEPTWDGFRSNGHFQELIKRTGLE